MKKRVVAAGVALLAVLVPLALAGAGKKEAAGVPPGKGHFLEMGKTYGFQFLPGVMEKEFVLYKVVEEPRDGWVRVGLNDEGGAQLIPTWINLQTVTRIEHNPQNDRASR